MATVPTAVLGGPPPVASLSISSASGTPGSTVFVDVTLNLLTTPPVSVVGAGNDIDFLPSTPISVAADGESPSCAVNPAINKRAFFTFLPEGCTGTACTGVNALIIPVSNEDPIPNGTILYSCGLQIADTAAPGSYALLNDDPTVLLSNDEEPPTTGNDGTVTVSAPLAACVGDCGRNGVVEINELVTGINIDLGLADVDTCPAFDRDGDGSVVVHELLQAVQGALEGCTADTALCERAAADGLRSCVESVSVAQRNCFLDNGAACAPDDDEVAAALDALEDAVLPACGNDEAVRAAGYGPSFTPVSLVHRLQAACRADTASLAARTFGGPQGAALATGTAQAVACLTATHAAGTRLLRDGLALHSNCVLADTACVAAQVNTQAAALQGKLTTDIESACGAGALQGLVAVDAGAYASRTAAQVRCLTAIAHPDSAPLALDCGPRSGLTAAPRGEYVQIVLEESLYGTRCGDGSPFAFWLRLAPEDARVDDVVVGMQGGGVCIFADDCATRPPDLFEALADQPETTGPLSNDPAISPFADWTKVYLPYCNQDVFIGGGATSNFPAVTVHRYGAINVRAALRYVRDVIWQELDETTEDGYRPDNVRALFGGFSAGAFGALYNYHYLLDDLQWAHSAAYPDAGLALDNGELLGIANLGVLLLGDNPPLGWSSRNYLPPYCFALNCGVGPVLLAASSPRLKAVPEQQFLILSNQVDLTQVGTTFFSTTPAWINEMRQSYCETRDLLGVQYYLPAISQNVHVISPRTELYIDRPVDGVIMRDWLASGFSAPDAITDRVEEGTLVDDYPGVMAFPCPLD